MSGDVLVVDLVPLAMTLAVLTVSAFCWCICGFSVYLLVLTGVCVIEATSR